MKKTDRPEPVRPVRTYASLDAAYDHFNLMVFHHQSAGTGKIGRQ